MRLRRLLLLLLALSSAWAHAATPAPGDAMLVLDVSGSMAGQVGGQRKMDLARAAVATLLKGWRTDQALGLMAYGHRRKGDCTDIELLRAPAKVDASLLQKVQALSPTGMTPISASVQQAAEQLRYTERKATVILVSDGEETCKADPCALAQSLERGGVDFTAHVVGFDLPAGPARAQLQCLAQRTGGRYLEARNAAELNQAMGELGSLAGGVAVKTAQAWIPGHVLEWDAGAQAEGQEDSGGTRVQEFKPGQSAKECQALCEADARCGGWHYEPTGSYFIEHPRCHLKGTGFPMRLRPEGEGFVAGVKPGVKLIRAEP